MKLEEKPGYLFEKKNKGFTLTMPALKFIIQGHVVDRDIQQGIANLIVTVVGLNAQPQDKALDLLHKCQNASQKNAITWQKSTFARSLFTRTTTNEQGNFTMRFTNLGLGGMFMLKVVC